MEIKLDEIERATELEYLKYFYSEADFGPADGDVRDIINERFVNQTGKLLPIGYNYNQSGEEL
jgi:hypothetical protein